MRGTPLSYDLAKLRAALPKFRLHWYPTVGSTNVKAAELRRAGRLVAPALVLTGRQTAGRGRGKHTWHSSRGCITATLVLPSGEPADTPQVPIRAGLALHRAAVVLTGCTDFGLKWPNDLLLGRRKVAGLLCERVLGIDLIGFGINVQLDTEAVPAGVTGRAASLADVTRRPLDLTDCLVEVVRQVVQLVAGDEAPTWNACIREYDGRHELVGKNVTIALPDGGISQGICSGLDAGGRLVLKSGGQSCRIVAGQVLSYELSND